MAVQRGRSGVPSRSSYAPVSVRSPLGGRGPENHRLRTGMAILGAGAAGAEKIETVLGDREALARCRRGKRRIELLLGLFVERKVCDVAARIADQVVMVAGQVLGEFVTRELIVGDDPTHRTSLFKDGQVSVHARLGERGVDFADLADGKRAATVYQRLDQPPPTARVTLVSLREKPSNFFIDIGGAHDDEDSEPCEASNALVVVVWVIQNELVTDLDELAPERLT